MIFNILHPTATALFLFDNSSNHQSFSPTALLLTKLNVSDGGENTNVLMRETTFGNPPTTQSLQFEGKQKGLKRILEERDVTQKMSKDAMKAVLSEEPDFKAQRK